MKLFRFVPLIVIIVAAVSLHLFILNEQAEHRKVSIPEMYLRADFDDTEIFQYAKSLEIYSKIIEIDRSEERAWHEKGRILNLLDRCEESFEHYSQYVKLFPNSERANEGFEIAKEC